jgi:hypothetical protein
MMTRNRAAASLGGLTLGVIGILSLVAPGYATADSPWDSCGKSAVSNISLADTELSSTTGTDDSPWD